MINIALLGSTGSIGTQVLNVVRRHSDKFKILSLSAGSNKDLFLRQVKEFAPKVACLESTGVDKEDIKEFKNTEFVFGNQSYLKAVVDEADVVVVSIVGFAGLAGVLEAIKKGKNIALANKESLVAGGEIVISSAEKKGVNIVPIDSEHSALWQALSFDRKKSFRKILLTASGGALKNMPIENLKYATKADALKHPNWDMGAKITIDSATMINKALEVIEARWLYNASFDDIEVVVHPQSIIHSMVEFEDSSVIAQMAYPSMELPIQLALSYPKRYNTDIPSLNFFDIKRLDFERLDDKRYPCFNVCVEAGKKGGIYPTVMNAANEIAVKSFLSGEIGYFDIHKIIESTLEKFAPQSVTVESIFANDKRARIIAEDIIKEIKR